MDSSGNSSNTSFRMAMSWDSDAVTSTNFQRNLEQTRIQLGAQIQTVGSTSGTDNRSAKKTPIFATANESAVIQNDTLKLLEKFNIGSSVQDDVEATATSKKRAKLNAWRKTLPIFTLKERFIEMVRKNQVCVVIGATGSGKSTQITQYLIEVGLFPKKIGCTQPRRVAAIALAKRVALEVGTTLGDKVGYKIRFENCTATDTLIKYMTDGVLVTEFSSDRNVDDYSVLVLDEAHERSVHTDVAIGLLKLCLRRRPDLKVIITSATLDANKFSGYFGGAPVLNIPGRGFPVEIEYTIGSDPDYVQFTVDKVMWIHQRKPRGDILVFLPGQEEIEIAWDLIYDADSSSKVYGYGSDLNLLVLPFYSSLPPDMLSKISEPTPSGSRKVILATNIAETSLTIENVDFVVDSGFAKQREYNPKTGIDTLILRQITKAQAIQRAGRTGRTAPGTVYRMYTKYAYESMQETPVPEIQRINVESVVLQLASLGITDIVNFPFIDPPPTESILAAMQYLLELQALSIGNGKIELTRIGRKMAAFPLDPALAKVLIRSAELGCAEEILTIVSILSTQNQNVFYRPKKKRVESDLKTSKFRHPLGDHLTLLNVWKEWKKNYSEPSWCRANFVESRTLDEAEEIRRQLAVLLLHQDLLIESCGDDFAKIQHALCSGFFHKVARKSKGYAFSVYAGGTVEEVYVFPGSALFKAPPIWVLYHEIVKTKKPYMRNLIKIEPLWIRKHSPTFFGKLKKLFPELAELC